MQLCRVVGSTVATVKADGLSDFKLLNVRPEKGDGPEFVAVDGVGAGEGDLVLVATGNAARARFHARRPDRRHHRRHRR